MSYSSPTAGRHPVTTQSAHLKLQYPPVTQIGAQRCCETGRPIMADPITGNTVCSCQVKTGTQAYLSRVPSLPETVYGTATSPQMFAPASLMGTEASAFYPMGLKPDRAPEGMKATPPVGHPPPYYIEHLMSAHPYNAFYPGLDLNNARRKNATRETTSALKAWLYEHRKNPYPTKGEKIMLAIITRMTLTQVSTWFANARRRLKKESKLDSKDDDDLLDIDIDIEEDSNSKRTSSSRLSSSDEDEHLKVTSDLSDISDAEDAVSRISTMTSSHCVHRLFSPEQRSDLTSDNQLCPASIAASHNQLSPVHMVASHNHLSSATITASQNQLSPATIAASLNQRSPTTIAASQNQLSPETIAASQIHTTTSGLSLGHGLSRDSQPQVRRTSGSGRTGNVQPRPKIWSISEIINDSKDSSS